MSLYRLSVMDQSGAVRRVEQEASSEEALIRQFASRDLFLLSIEPAPAAGAGRKRRYAARTILEFTETLALMLRSGLSLNDALEVADSVFTRGEARDLTGRLIERIRKGASFLEAIGQLSRSFPPVYRGLVRIGERVGSLDRVFERLVQYLREEKKLREKLVNSLIYPILVLSVALLGVLGISFFLLPKVAELFGQLGQGMSERMSSTLRALRATSVGVAAFLLLALAASAGVAALRRRGGKAAVAIDAFLLRLPLGGPILAIRELMNLSFGVETLTGSGVPVETALSEAQTLLKNLAYRQAVERIHREVREGELLSAAFRRQAVFPERVGRWIHVGERVGQVEQVFGQLRAFYQGEVEKWSARFLNLIEPAIIILVGGIVLFIILVFVVPIFSLYGSIL